MAETVTRVGIKFQTGGSTEVSKAFKKLTREIGVLKRNFSGLSGKELASVKKQLLSVNGATANSINSMQAQKIALQGLRNMADVTGLEFKELTKDIALLDAKLKQAASGGAAAGFKGRLKGFAKGAGAVAAAGIFGGPEGAVGAGIGAIAGGPVGAAVGGAIGAQVGMVRKSLGEVAEYSAALGLQRKALKLVIGDTDKFNKSQEFLRKTSKELAIPQDVITRQFTALTASVVGAGQSVEDAEEVFQAIAAGIRGTGGTLEDMKAAMRATSQVFSKGKVSAEELRQQLGERLPGAFTLFADSMDMTPAMLDKALEQGKVTLDDFMKFAKKLFSTYGENSKILAQGPEAAGDRLKTEMSELKDNVGKLLRPIGAEFQDTFAKIVKAINPAIEALVKFQNKLRITNVEEEIKKLEKIIKRGFKDIGGTMGSGILGGGIPVPVKGDELDLTRLKVTKLKQELLDLQGVEKTKGVGLVADPTEYLRSLVTKGEGQLEDVKTPTTTALNNLQEGAKAYFETIKDFGKQTQDAVASAFKGMEDAIVKFVTTGKLNFGDLTRSILADLTRIAIRSAMFNMGKSIFPSFFNFPTDKKNAMGNVYDAGNKISKFAYGGVVNKPKLFPMANGIGLMGEAGPEAILPLQRGRGGKLGVIAQGGGTGNITVNVDASGSSAEGDNQISAELGNAIGAAIQAELVNQKRPGGLLA